MTAPEVGASLLVANLEQAWAAIRGRHPEVPEAVVVVAAGGEGRRLRWGHFAAGRWQLPAGRRPEVLVGGEGLRRPTREVLGTLLHEAAHGLADRRGIQDTSRGGRYHNRRYRQLAEEVGLQVACVDPIGWSATTVPDPTAASYAGVLAELADQLTLWRREPAATCWRALAAARAASAWPSPPCRPPRSSAPPASCPSPQPLPRKPKEQPRMDPDACLARLLDAAVAGDAEELLAAAGDLAGWLRHSGYPPDDPRELQR